MIDNEKLIEELINSGKLRPDDVLAIENDMKKKDVLKLHRQKITQPNTTNGRWQTYVKGDDGKRKKISAMTEKRLYAKLYERYYVTTYPTVTDMLPVWIEKKRSENRADGSLQRYMVHWKKYYAETKIVNCPINCITPEMVEEFFHKLIDDHQMTLKELNNMKYPFKEILKHAVRKGYLDSNPFQHAELMTDSCLPKPNYSKSTRVYLANEKTILFEELNKEILMHPSVTDMLGIFLLFTLGLRIGELVSLKFSDIDYEERDLHIQRTESKKMYTDGVLRPAVVPHTKNKSPHGDRFIPLGDYEFEVIAAIIEVNKRYGFKDDDYIFVDEDGRTTSRAIDNRIRKLCVRGNIPVKSAHDIRRTVASEMYANDVSLELIREFMGHADIATTLSYIYDLNEKKVAAKKIRDSLKGMNGLKRTHFTEK